MMKPMSKIRFLPLGIWVSVGLTGLPFSATASDLYKWTDPAGKTHYSTTVPPDAVRGEYQKMNPSLTNKQISKAEMTQAERDLAEQNRKKMKEQEQTEKELKAKRTALLERYKSDEEFTAEIKATEADYERMVAKSLVEIKALEKNITVLSAQTPPNKLGIAKERRELEERTSFIEKRKIEKESRVEKLNADKKEWLEAKKK